MVRQGVVDRLLAAVAGAAALLAGAGAGQAATVVMTVTDVPPDSTLVLAALCSGSLEASACGYGQRQPADAASLRFTFTDVPPGRYAFLAFQDVSGTGTLEHSRLGLPLEPYALSNNAGATRRPTFERAAFDVKPEGYAATVRMRQLRARSP